MTTDSQRAGRAAQRKIDEKRAAARGLSPVYIGNPYHDAKGLFSTAAGDADGKASGGRSSDEVTQRAANNGLTDAEYKAKYGMTPAQFQAKLAKSAKIGPSRGKDYKNDVFSQTKAKATNEFKNKQAALTKGTLATLGGRGVMVGDSANGITTVHVGGRSLRVKTTDLKKAADPGIKAFMRKKRAEIAKGKK